MKSIYTAICFLVICLFPLSACEVNEHYYDRDPNDGEREHSHAHEHKHGHTHDGSVSVQFADFRLTVLGDSVAVGFLGDTQMGAELPADNQFFAALLSGNPQHPSAFDEHYKHHYKNAFSSGKHCVSLACHIEHNNFYVDNLAVSGARASGERDVDIAAQLTRADVNTTHYVLEAGTNDFCDADFDHDKVLTSIKSVSEKILARNAEAQLLIVPVLPVVSLFRDVTSPADTAFTQGDQTFTCAQIRDGGLAPPEHQQAASLCPRLNGADTAQLDAMQAELDALNAALSALAHQSDAATSLNATPPKEEGDLFTTDAHRITVATSLATQVFEQQHLAADCFHPSRAGLELIAKQAFSHVPDWKPHRVVVTDRQVLPLPKVERRR